MTPTGVATIEVGKGVCYALFAYEVGLAIKLDEAERRITAMTQRFSLKRTRRAPHYFEYRPAPLRVTFEIGPMVFADFCSSASVDAVLYDFGAISVAYRIPLEGAFHRLLDLNEALYDNAMLVADSRSRVDHLLATIGEAVERPSVSESVEDYVIFQIEEWKPASTGEELYTRHARDVTQVLRCERQPLSEQEVQDALSCRISFGPDDVTIIDWNTGLLFGRDTEDERAVLEFANVELLEMRHLDQQLDDALDQAYEVLSRRMDWRLRWPGTFDADKSQIAQLQVDSALLFERVTNALKLVGDQYLARVSRLASQRFHLEEWDASILRKLETLDSIYGKMSDQVAARRMEVLEWIIILLIAVSIAVSFLPGLAGH
ncbi:MAG TPA: hypothetical protein VGQ07_03335 [Nitrospirales bacterium]|nr:hypothetical protein [Nitrospirales bacterium]